MYPIKFCQSFGGKGEMENLHCSTHFWKFSVRITRSWHPLDFSLLSTLKAIRPIKLHCSGCGLWLILRAPKEHVLTRRSLSNLLAAIECQLGACVRTSGHSRQPTNSYCVQTINHQSVKPSPQSGDVSNLCHSRLRSRRPSSDRSCRR